MRKLLSVKEASKYLGISPNTIRKLISKRQIPFRNISAGRKAVFRLIKWELDAWVNRLPGLQLDDLE